MSLRLRCSARPRTAGARHKGGPKEARLTRRRACSFARRGDQQVVVQRLVFSRPATLHSLRMLLQPLFALDSVSALNLRIRRCVEGVGMSNSTWGWSEGDGRPCARPVTPASRFTVGSLANLVLPLQICAASIGRASRKVSGSAWSSFFFFFFGFGRSPLVADSFEDSFDDYVAWTQQKAARALQAPPAAPKVDRIEAVPPGAPVVVAAAPLPVVPLVKTVDVPAGEPKGGLRLNAFFCASYNPCSSGGG